MKRFPSTQPMLDARLDCAERPTLVIYITVGRSSFPRLTFFFRPSSWTKECPFHTHKVSSSSRHKAACYSSLYYATNKIGRISVRQTVPSTLITVGTVLGTNGDFAGSIPFEHVILCEVTVTAMSAVTVSSSSDSRSRLMSGVSVSPSSDSRSQLRSGVSVTVSSCIGMTTHVLARRVPNAKIWQLPCVHRADENTC